MLTPAPIAVIVVDEVDGLGHVVRFVEGVAVVDGVIVCVMASDAMVVDVTVIVVVSLALGAVEPDVRLNMTLPAFRLNGVKVPRVLWLHEAGDASVPQQNVLAVLTKNIDTLVEV